MFKAGVRGGAGQEGFEGEELQVVPAKTRDTGPGTVASK